MAGLILLGWAYAAGKIVPINRQYLLRQSLAGLAMITGGNGFITWAMQHVSTGVASIIGSLTPVVVVLINIAWRGAERINVRMLSGVLLGFAGLGLIFSDGWKEFSHAAYVWGIGGCFASCFTWSLGTVMAKRFNRPDVSPVFNAGLQITAGGIGGFIMSAMFDQSHTIQHTAAAWSAVLYLALIGSALAFSLYMFTLRHLSATISSLYTYINPVVAIILGWLFLHEPLGWLEALGMALTIAGVYLTNWGSR